MKKSDYLNQKFSFHPDSVVEFLWKVGDDRFVFKRQGRLEPWVPSVDSRFIQNRLNLISSAYGRRVNISNDPKVELKLLFDNGQGWSALFDGKYFKWLDGPLSGQGVKLREEHKRFFYAGKNAFSSNKIRLCMSRPVSFEFNVNRKKGIIKKRGNVWLYSQNDENFKNVTDVEKWIGKNCYLTVDEIIDGNIFKIEKLKNELKIKFEKNGPKKIFWKNNYFKIVEADNTEILFISDDLKSELNKILISL